MASNTGGLGLIIPVNLVYLSAACVVCVCAVCVCVGGRGWMGGNGDGVCKSGRKKC